LLAALSAFGEASRQPAPAADGPGRTQAPAAAGTPATQPSADQTLDDLLKPAPADPAKPLTRPSSGVANDRSSGNGAVVPRAPAITLLREGTYVVDRIARLSRPGDGSQAELAFESDGRGLKDPPMVILPNLKLMQMEGAIVTSNRDLRFRVTGMVTEYRGRNYILLEKVIVVSDADQPY
jgi:hypothetical protein